jgi:hypothetical protein
MGEGKRASGWGSPLEEWRFRDEPKQKQRRLRMKIVQQDWQIEADRHAEKLAKRRAVRARKARIARGRKQ